jgi:hypothetical protein
MTENSWEGILDRDETVLWQGRPDPGFHMPIEGIFKIVFFAFFTGFSVFWMAMAGTGGGLFWVFGLPFFLIGGSSFVWALIGPTMTRRNSWYTVTTKRALIASELPIVGRQLKSFRIDRDTNLDFREGPLSSIYFATERRRGKNGTYPVKVGFERIPDGREVYQHLRSVQTSRPQESAS